MDDPKTEHTDGESEASHSVVADETELLSGLRTGDEQAFVTLVTGTQGPMLA